LAIAFTMAHAASPRCFGANWFGEQAVFLLRK
jgi:hypothetical protein